MSVEVTHYEIYIYMICEYNYINCFNYLIDFFKLHVTFHDSSALYFELHHSVPSLLHIVFSHTNNTVQTFCFNFSFQFITHHCIKTIQQTWAAAEQNLVSVSDIGKNPQIARSVNKNVERGATYKILVRTPKMLRW